MLRLKTDLMFSPAAKRTAVLVTGIVVAHVMSVSLWAQQQTEGFLPRTGATESLAASPLVFIAYGFVWVALAAYVFLLWRRIGKVEQELGELRKGQR